MTLVSIAAVAVLAGVFALGVKIGVQGAGTGVLGGSVSVARERAELALLKGHLQRQLLLGVRQAADRGGRARRQQLQRGAHGRHVDKKSTPERNSGRL